MTTVLWDIDEAEGLVLEPEARMNETIRTVQMLRQAGTVGELRRAELPDWAQRIVQEAVELLQDQGVDDTDQAPWRWSDHSEAVIDEVPLPWDVASVTRWLDEELLTKHAKIGGASPAGNIDTYRVEDPNALLTDLERQGYTLQHRPGLLREFYRVL